MLIDRPISLVQFLTCLCVVTAVAWADAADGLDPAESLKKIRIAQGLRIELIACEPAIVDPVAVAWDEYGRMFVVEMRDYPNGPGEGKPFLSCVKRLEDRDGDGKYETVSLFADQLPFANGVLPWQGGIIVTAAPDIWFLKDTDGDGKADVREKLFTGFKEGNPQLRVNHPTLGIDNWIYVANGLSGGEVRRADTEDSVKIPIAQMDFRFRPDRSEFEATAGNAQFGLVFDDFGNRFMCSNRQHVAHVVLPDRYLKRNPYLGVAKTVLDIPDHGAAARIFPLTTTRTTAVEHAGTFTAACGLAIFRGSALAEPYRGNSFVCDPTGYLVHRDVLVPAGPTFVAKRATEETRQEFLASTDEWFRPVNLANSPDGSLVLVDMYRETIEHPQYMPKGLAETLDLRKGDDRGRIYRITGESGRQPIARWPAKMGSEQLVQALGHPDAWWRETAQRLLIERNDSNAVQSLRALAQSTSNPIAKIHALWALEGLSGLEDNDLLHAMNDARAAVREHAVRLVEPRLGASPALSNRLVALAGDPDGRVRFRVALALGEIGLGSSANLSASGDIRIKPLARMIERDAEDSWVQNAVLSSAAGIAGDLWSNINADFTLNATPAKSAFVERIASIVGARRDKSEVDLFLRTFVARQAATDTWWQLAAINGLSFGLRASGKNLAELLTALSDDVRPAAARVERLLAESSQIVLNKTRSVPERVAATRLAGNLPTAELMPIIRELLDVSQPQEVQLAAVQAVDSVNDSAVVPILLDGWSSHSPPIRREAVEAIFRRRERVVQLLDAIEAGKLRVAELDLNRHQQLLDHSIKEIKERAARLFENEGTPNRKEVIESYRGVLAQSGNGVRGREIFKKNCATCHQIQGEGHRVGPELTGLRSRNKEALLMDILDPNRALEPNYANYLIATKDGRVLSGIIASENATSITLRRAEGVEDVLLRQDLEQIRASGQSLMPDGFERTVTQAEMVDLIEYLRTVP